MQKGTAYKPFLFPLLFINRLKIIRSVPAQRTCVVLRQCAALIHIPANFAPPADDLLLSLDLLRLRLQLILVIRICQRSAVAAHLGFRHLCNEQRMRAEVNTVRHLAAEPRAGAPVQIRYATFVGRLSSLSTSRPLCIPKCLMVSNEQLSSNALNVNRPLSLISAQV